MARCGDVHDEPALLEDIVSTPLPRPSNTSEALFEPDDVFYLRTDELTRAVRAIVLIEALAKRG